jgi:hypothetical protein
VCASVGRVNNMNKLSLVGMQLPEKYKENFEYFLADRTFFSISIIYFEYFSAYRIFFSLYFSGSCIPTNESLFIFKRNNLNLDIFVGCSLRAPFLYRRFISGSEKSNMK